MANPTSAEIIPFPATRLSTPFYGPAAPLPASERLGTALDSLSAALTEQHCAIQRWRTAMADLAASMRALSGALQPQPQHTGETQAS